METTATKGRPAAGAGVHGSPPRATASPAWMWRSGRVAKGLLALFLLFDGGARLAGFAPYVEGTVQAGFAAAQAPGIGLTLIAATVLYLIPRTAVLGAIVLTGYLGGATATHVRLGLPFLFPLAFGVLVWGALFLLDSRIRDLVGVRR